MISAIKIFKWCCSLKVIGVPVIKDCNLKKAIIDPENVMAPIESPTDISILLMVLILCFVPIANNSGERRAQNATRTAANPTRLWKAATNCGIAVIFIF